MKIGDICTKICSGGTPASSIKEYYNGNIPWLNTKEVCFNRVYNTEKKITQLGYESSAAKLIPSNSVIVAMYGATAAKCCINKIPLTTNQACCNLIIDETKGDYNFIYYYICYKYNELLSLTNGAAQQNLNTQIIKDFEIPSLSLEKQKAIAAVLSALDDKIEVNCAINKNLEATAQATFQDMFIGNYDPNWKNGTIDDLGTIVSGGTPSTTKPEYYCANGIPWITPKDLSLNSSKFIYRGKIDISEFGLKNSSAKILPKGSVLFSSRAPIGYIAIAANDVTTNQGFKSIIPVDEIGTAFVYFFLKQNLSIIEGRASGSTFKEVSGTTMKSVPAVIPDVKKLNEFNLLCVPIFNKQKKVEAENQRLAAIRDALLPKLMSGEIDVSQVKI